MPPTESSGPAKTARQRRDFRREALRLAAIVASSDDAIISKDLNGVVQSWNQAAERMFGYTADEAIGRLISDLIIPEERKDEEFEVLSRIRAGLSVDHYETVRHRKDGSALEISLSVSPIRSASGKIVGASKIARDITERNRLQRELEQANRAKDEFLATLSHELRTPLNAILGYARILGERLADPQSRRAANIIERNAQALTQLVSDVLDVSAISAGKTRLDLAPCDLVKVLEEALAVVAPTADAKGVALVQDLPSEPVEILGDARRLQQVFWNILLNAVKFTPNGGRVTAVLVLRPTEVAVTVIDTGIGIEPDFLPRVFQRFSQAARHYGGIGIGLALVRHLVELHGGSVSAHSEGPGHGATFEVVIPRRPRIRQPVSVTSGITAAQR
jgi:PAS domain S-box-containing protein